MPLTPEQIQDLKEQLKQQIQHLPEAQKAQALQQIESLSHQALEAMLKQQQEKNPRGKKEEQESIFRSIISGKIPSAKIEENPSALAVLDIAPISKGHVIIIPKSPVKDSKQLPIKAFSLAKKIGKRIVSKLKALRIEIATEVKFGEAIINVIPIYDSPLYLGSPRAKSSLEQLEDIARLLTLKPKIPLIKIKPSKDKQNQSQKLNKRIP